MGKDSFSTVSVRLTLDEKEAIIAYCEENDMSMSQVIRKAVKEYIQQKN